MLQIPKQLLEYNAHINCPKCLDNKFLKSYCNSIFDSLPSQEHFHCLCKCGFEWFEKCADTLSQDQVQQLIKQLEEANNKEKKNTKDESPKTSDG